ncbi:MAG: MFS transporter [Gammaproteobacteria bacterium]|nr:MFS transporter [Gammaproteobacteria bacterium]
MRISSSKKAMLAGISGTAIQWYDFAIFGYFAPIIAAIYFPKDSAMASLLHVFAVFAVGYVLAPVGSMFFGYIGDRYGRKRALMLSIFSMAIPTAMIALLPGFKTIGIVAPILITLLRMTQGFAASSEFTGSAVFLVEHAKPGRRAFYGCLTSSAYSVGVIFAGLTTSFLTASFMPNWGWRIGFGMASIAGFIIFYLRRDVSETPVYAKINHEDKLKRPFLMAIKTVPYAVIGVIGLGSLIGIMTFGTYVFTASYLHRYFNFSLSTATLITTASLAVVAVLEPLMAILADKIGHLKQLVVGMFSMFCLSFPVFYLITSGHVGSVMLGMIVMSILIATAFAPINAYMLALFPDNCRYSGFGVSFHIGISLFGSTAPLVLMWLVNKTGDFTAPAYYYMLGAFIGLGSLAICEYGRRAHTNFKQTLLFR